MSAVNHSKYVMVKIKKILLYVENEKQHNFTKNVDLILKIGIM